MSNRLRETQLLKASARVKKMDVRRHRTVRRMIGRLKPNPLLNAASFYLATGSVPRSLWDND